MKKTLILQAPELIHEEALEYWLNRFQEDAKKGIVIIPSFFEVISGGAGAESIEVVNDRFEPVGRWVYLEPEADPAPAKSPAPGSGGPYWDRVSAIAARQRKKGMETYGQGIEANPEEVRRRVEMLQEELVDALIYTEWWKEGLDE